MKTFQEMLRAAESGDAEAMNDVAVAFARGDLRQPVNGAKALYWYEKACAAGSGKALGNLAFLYLTGTFIGEDPVRAVALYEQAVEKEPGCDSFLYDLARCYEIGHGTAPDRDRAVRLYRRAASLGSGMARGALRRLGKGIHG